MSVILRTLDEAIPAVLRGSVTGFLVIGAPQVAGMMLGYRIRSAGDGGAAR